MTADVDAAVDAVQPATARASSPRSSATTPPSTTGSTPPSTPRSSATASPAGSTASTPSTRPSSACPTGRAAGCSAAAACCRATRCTRSATAADIADPDAAPLMRRRRGVAVARRRRRSRRARGAGVHTESAVERARRRPTPATDDRRPRRRPTRHRPTTPEPPTSPPTTERRRRPRRRPGEAVDERAATRCSRSSARPTSTSSPTTCGSPTTRRPSVIDGTVDDHDARSTAPLDEIALDAAELAVEAVTVDGAPATFEHDRRRAARPPGDAASAPGAPVVDRRHVPRRRATPVGVGVRPRRRLVPDADGGSYVLNEPDGARTWLPSNDHPSDKATWRFELTVPDGRHRGRQRRARRAAAGRRRRRRGCGSSDEPMATYLVQLLTGDYEVLDGGVGRRRPADERGAAPTTSSGCSRTST